MNSLTRIIADALILAQQTLATIKQANISTKANGSLVTAADEAVGAAITAYLRQHLPAGHVVVDEEAFDRGETAAPDWQQDQVQWLIDPIAGTGAYTNGLPFYAIAIGALQRGAPKAGGICFPALGETYLSDAVDIWQNGARILSSVALPQQGCGIEMLYHHGATIINNTLDVGKISKVIVQLPVINIGLLWVALRRVTAGLFHPYAWDLAAAWPLLKACNIGLYDSVTGAQLERITDEWLTPALRFQRTLLACDPAIAEEMLHRIARATLPAPGMPG